MMAHELPLPIHQTQHKVDHSSGKPAAKPKQNKAIKNPTTSAKDEERRLPNGAKVDFGNGTPPKAKNQKKKANTDNEVSNSVNNTKKKATNKANTQSLPNGDKPNFYNDSQSDVSSKKKFTEAALPNGEKPNFYNSESSNPKNKKKNSSEQSLPNGDKPNFGASNEIPTSNKKKDKNIAAVEDNSYAGSSFHSSPAALNLPKPSFKSSSSPKQSANGISDDVTQQSPPTPAQTIPIVAAPPPQFPVTAYPPGSVPAPMRPNSFYPPQYAPQPPYIQPGFAYNVNPQGYIQYQYPPFHHPMGQNPIVTHYQQPSPYPPNSANTPPSTGTAGTSTAGGQKISFNDLLGSAKN
ncbi:enhancer of mRNA-decapping protein 1 [Scheffersomyces xylosifermentans]|uniref:enhancer of mRNA-decapping protein 1 n=1 Tax=Scheffersomyces xylosifermentans TaxID=1304137 RepID=UPI00315C6C09